MTAFEVEQCLSELTLDEKVTLLSGIGACSTAAIKRLNIPNLHVRGSDALNASSLADKHGEDFRWTARFTWRRRSLLQRGQNFQGNDV